MRPGLVAIGTAFLVLGAVAAGASLSQPSPPSRTETSTAQWSWSVPSDGAYQSPLLWGLNGSFGISWSASVLVSATLFGSAPGSGKTLFASVYSWPNVTRGSWSAEGAPSYPYYLVFTSSARSSGSIAASTQSSNSVPPPATDMLALVAGTLAGVTLVGLGGIALFLGLFLRGNLLGRRPPLVSQRAEDVGAIAEQYPPPPPSG
ncbi:MAG: hypothetical protein L3K13_03410 [Thermoplasmata archaeon]|nr:hypothetical protein [Thermoplasmata archaeon]